MFQLNDKTVIITGATGNLGRITAQICAAQGARLALVGRDPQRLAEIKQTLAADCAADIFVADVLDTTAVEAMVTQVAARFGQIDVLANLAGGFTMGALVHETPNAEWDAMLALNLRSVINCVRATVPHLLTAGSGRIINIAARAATQGSARMAPYCVSKAAVVTLTESLAAELKSHDITVNCLLPGTLDTPENRAAMPDQEHQNWVALDALAAVIVFLASDAARAITGAAIPVYGRS
ncbi:SDR family NAD(P)-dependent oxidoreductase [Chromatium okenii]|jgi:NAD(P)-dependent dehydrogenase (short-subunit alcohol dehydrogenase family)|uniref:3-oxoacyl-ACP reductase n=1 Tax=Chromatium okenii TaxID=61644 RepID=A0A2S7XR24_9GAMM|nr:SDR family NAD(P)-dependent oxidoreductase [Chromatium okenii]PQJ96189.1 3-oxoacyl-ACP reductase [Chromatium okenii]